MRKLTVEQHGKLAELVLAFAEDHARCVMAVKENPASVDWDAELVSAGELGMAITNYVDSLL